MKTIFKRTFLMVGLACAVTVASAAIGSPKKKGKSMYSNPLMQKSPLPYGAPISVRSRTRTICQPSRPE